MDRSNGGFNQPSSPSVSCYGRLTIDLQKVETILAIFKLIKAEGSIQHLEWDRIEESFYAR